MSRSADETEKCKKWSGYLNMWNDKPFSEIMIQLVECEKYCLSSFPMLIDS